MAGRHVARTGGLRRVGDAILAHPLPAGAVVTAALVAAVAVTPLGVADLMPAPAHSRSPVPGPAPVIARTVPNVVGASASSAGAALRARGFSTDFRTESGGTAADRTDDVVIGQSPGAGARAVKGATISLTVAPAGSGVSTPPQNAAGAPGPGTVSAPAGSDTTPAAGVAGGAGGAGSGGAGTAGTGGGRAVPAPPASAPVPQPPAVPPPAPPVTPPPVVPAPSVPVPIVPVPTPPVPTLPGSPLRVVSGLLRGIA